MRRGIVLVNCGTTRLAEQVANVRPFLRVLFDATLTPTTDQICPASPFPFRGEQE